MGRRIQCTPEDIAIMRILAKRGMGAYQIGQVLKRSPGTVYRWAELHGVYLPQRGDISHRCFQSEARRELPYDAILDAYAEGRTTASIAEQFGLWGTETVRTIALRARRRGDPRAAPRGGAA